MSAGGGMRPLLPAAGSPPPTAGPSRHRELVPRQPHVASACSQCRKSKSKCSGDKPQCVRCATKDLTCEYDGELAGVGLAELRKKHRELASQKEALQFLLTYMANRPISEAQSILARLRLAKDPESLMNLVMSGDLILQQHTTGSMGDESDKIRQLEQYALRDSSIKVTARPWTGIVGDGLVSDLISSFMAFDQPFLFVFIDRDRFLEDMNNGSSAGTRYCSPFLVNAICALRSHTSESAKAYSKIKSVDLRELFLNEAQQHLSLERGKVSLATAQGLVIMFMCCAGMGRDRAGRMFRYMAYDMLQRLHLLKAQRDLGSDPEDKEKLNWSRAASRASWGLYCFESIVSFAYNQQSILPRPTCPRTFLGHKSSRSPDGEFDPSFVFDAMCDLSIIHNEAMKYHLGGKYQLGSEHDLARRSQFLARIRDWRMGLTDALHFSNNPTMGVYMLRSFEDQTILSIVKDLDDETTIPMTDLLVRDVSISCCMRSIEGLDIFKNDCDAGRYSCYLVFPMYNAAVNLIDCLGIPSTHELFTYTCHHLIRRSKDFPFTAFLLQGLKTLAERLHKDLPPKSMQYFEALDFTEEELRDVPITFVIPDHEQIMRELGDEQEDSEDVGVQLGALITKWSWQSMR